MIVLFTACSDTQDSNDNSNVDLVCTEIYVYGINVRVFDEADNIVTDALVTITDGDYSETLELQENDYVGAGERPGNYTLEVEKSGYSPHSENVKVQADECHVIPESVEVKLSRS